MQECKYHEVCGLWADADPQAGFCILHSVDPTKDRNAFAAALEAHRKKNRANFRRIVFPADTDFSRATFFGEANFVEARFTKTNFSRATFIGNTDFSRVTFTGETDFSRVTFTGETDFSRATFIGEADFVEAKFAGGANFSGVTFTGETDFSVAKFTKGADFSGATFTRKADFQFSSFRGRTLFTSYRGETGAIRIFSGVEVDFRHMISDPPDALSFLEADLSKCRFQDTDLRKVLFVDVLWAQIGSRCGVYDEIVPLEPGAKRPWSLIERLYRELKQNYEDRRDYERAGDFHYGEKEMRRLNPDTPIGLRCILTFYWLSSGYGERYLRPLICAGILFTVCTIWYLVLGLVPDDDGPRLALTNMLDWLRSAHYSFRVMTLLKPEDLIPIGYGKVLNTIQTILGPIFFGLLALALRQRLKR